MKHMKKPLLLLIAVLLTACGKPKDPVARGKAYFAGLGCITCHRVGERGGGQAGPDLTFVGFRKSPEWLDLWLQSPQKWKPGTSMPDFKLKPDVRSDIVAYMASLKGQDYQGKEPWNAAGVKDDPVKKGEVLFNKVGCVGCHGSLGAGGYPNNNVVGGKIPSLTFAADGYSKAELHERIAKGKKSDPENPSLPAPMIYMPAWEEKLSSEEIDALVDYVYSLKPQDSTSDWSE
jgi:mono/diheme cytochrome c family protein